MTIKELQEKIDKNNTEYGTSFSLGGSYGNCELWAKDKNGGDNRLEAGSVDDCYNTWVKYRFNEKYKITSIERKGSMKKLSEDYSKNQELKIGDSVIVPNNSGTEKGTLKGKVTEITRVKDYFNNEAMFNKAEKEFDYQGLSWDKNSIMLVKVDFDSNQDNAFTNWARYNPSEILEITNNVTAMKKLSDYKQFKNIYTWIVAYRLVNEESTAHMVGEWIKGAKEDSPKSDQVSNGIWTVDQAVKFKVADQVKDYMVEQNELASQNSIHSELMAAALEDIDYVEIAEELIAE